MWLLIAGHRAAVGPRQILLGEWDVFTGRTSNMASSPSWYAEMHPARNNQSGYVATLWNTVSGSSTSLTTIPLFDQYDISFKGNWDGAFTSIRERTLVPFAFTHETPVSATFSLSNGRSVQIAFHADNMIEVLMGDIAVTAMRQVPVAIPRELLALKVVNVPVKSPLDLILRRIPQPVRLLGGAILAAAVLAWAISELIAAVCGRRGKTRRPRRVDRPKKDKGKHKKKSE
jgi:hypothetical protein